MAVFGKVDDCLVPRGAFDNDFFRWLKKPKGIQKRHLDIADVGSLASSPMANVLAGKPKESSQAAVRSRFRDGGGDVTIVQQFFARTFHAVSIYNIPAFANFINAPTRSSAWIPNRVPYVDST